MNRIETNRCKHVRVCFVAMITRAIWFDGARDESKSFMVNSAPIYRITSLSVDITLHFATIMVRDIRWWNISGIRALRCECCWYSYCYY